MKKYKNPSDMSVISYNNEVVYFQGGFKQNQIGTY